MDKKTGIIVLCLVIASALIGFLLFKKPSASPQEPPVSTPPSSSISEQTTEEPTIVKKVECPSDVKDTDYVFQKPQLGSTLLSS